MNLIYFAFKFLFNSTLKSVINYINFCERKTHEKCMYLNYHILHKGREKKMETNRCLVPR